MMGLNNFGQLGIDQNAQKKAAREFQGTFN